MANNTILAWSYDDKAVREDLLDIMTNIDPTEANFQDAIQTTSAKGVLHEWPIDILDTPGVNANIEGSDFGTPNMTNPTRKQNLVQTFRKDWKISGLEMELVQAGFTDRKAYELGKKLKSLKNDLEYAMVRGSQVTGNGTNVASQLTGVKNALSTNVTSQSGVSLTEVILVNYLSNTWTNGGRVNAIYVGGTLKQRITSFSGNNTRFVDADEQKLVNTISAYASDFGAPVIEIKLHRYITVAGDVNNDILGLQEDTWAKSFVRPPHNEDLGKVGDSERGMLVADATLEYRAEKASFLGKAHF